jgi:hypothetical protein
VDQVITSEFPFVEAMPKREKSKLVRLWDMVFQMLDENSDQGMLLPVMTTAKLLNLSRTRIDELCAAGRLHRVVIDNHIFVGVKSIKAFADLERKTGRPLKVEFEK